MLAPGIYPASVTPFDSSGRLDAESLARLLAGFEAAGCEGVVLAGTNGEGPSLSAPEKRDLVALAKPLAGSIALILGIATPSLSEAVWLAKQAAKEGCVAVLVMPPAYWRNVGEEAIAAWFMALMDASPLPVIAYNHPAMTGLPVTRAIVQAISGHERFAGIKDSSGFPENLPLYREAVPAEKAILVGDETLLADALRHGWTGSISGAANVLAPHLVQIVRDHLAGDRESVEERQALIQPLLETIRSSPQPATHKGVLRSWGRLASDSVRLPLRTEPTAARRVLELIEATVGAIR